MPIHGAGEKSKLTLCSCRRGPGEERFPRYLELAIIPQTHCTSGAPVHRSRFRFNSSARLALAPRGKRQADPPPRLAVCSARSSRARVQRVDGITANYGEVPDLHGIPVRSRKILSTYRGGHARNETDLFLTVYRSWQLCSQFYSIEMQ